MSRKQGIFKQYKDEILTLISQEIGYTEIAEIFNAKYGIKVTKQNLEQSHKRYLKKQSEKSLKKGRPKRSDNSHKGVPPKAPQALTKKYHTEALESIFSSPEDLAETLAFRERLPRIQLELKSLVDAEASSGRFTGTESSLLSGWANALFVQHPDTALEVFKRTLGGNFSTYLRAFDEALKHIHEQSYYCAHESRARPADEETALLMMKLERENRMRLKREQAIAQAVRDMTRNPELYEGVEFKFQQRLKE